MDSLEKILSKVLNVDINKINDDFSRDTCEEWDSFNHLLIISEIEHELGVRIDFQNIEKIRSYQDLKTAVASGKNIQGDTDGAVSKF